MTRVEGEILRMAVGQEVQGGCRWTWGDRSMGAGIGVRGNRVRMGQAAKGGGMAWVPATGAQGHLVPDGCMAIGAEG